MAPFPTPSRSRRWLDLLFGGGPASSRAATALLAALMAALLGLSWLAAYALGGAGRAAPHWFYVPILLSASWLGAPGAAFTALAAAVLAGPLLPLEVGSDTPQHLSDWTSRGAFFLGIGQLMAWVIARRRRAEEALEESRVAVTALSERLAGHRGARDVHDGAARRVREVLEAGGPQIVFQPIADLRTGRVIGREALSRFDHPYPATPDRWFAEAWDAGLGVELETAALRAALVAARDLSPHAYLSVNLSPDALLADELEAALPAVPPQPLVIELTEHARIESYEALRRRIRKLRGRGIRLAIDDAGAGFASLRHILLLAPDLIKLDVTLTRGIDSDPALRALARGLITFSSELGSAIIAEGVETAGELETLRGLGVSFGQGFHLGRPVPATFDLGQASAW